jgi:nucleoid-associated protein YgaU
MSEPAGTTGERATTGQRSADAVQSGGGWGVFALCAACGVALVALVNLTGDKAPGAAPGGVAGIGAAVSVPSQSAPPAARAGEPQAVGAAVPAVPPVVAPAATPPSGASAPGASASVASASVPGSTATTPPTGAPVATSPAATSPAATSPAATSPAATPPIAAGTATPPAAAAPPVEPASETAPRFDIVRVEASGDIVVAGRAAAGATVELMVDGRKHDREVADLTGQFAIIPKPLQSGQHELSLRATSPEGRVERSRQSVTIVIPARGDRGAAPLVTLSDPDKPTAVLQTPAGPPPVAAGAPSAAAGRPPTQAAPAQTSPAPRVNVRIVTLESDDAGRFFASGSATPGATIRLYMNETLLGRAVADAGGQWSFMIAGGLVPGRYTIRMDDVVPETGVVLSRAEAAFDHRPVLAAAPPSRAQHAPAPSAPMSAAPLPSAPLPSPPLPAAPLPAAPLPVAPLPVAPLQSAAAPAPSDAPGSPAAPLVSAGLAPGAIPPPPDAANVTLPVIRSETVRRGDSLWRISRRIYGQGVRYTTIFAANSDQIRDPRRIWPGQVFVVPGEGAAR